MATAISSNPTLDSSNGLAGFVQTVFTVKLSPGLDGSDEYGDFSTYSDIIGFSAMTDSSNGGSPTLPVNDPQIQAILTQSNKAVPDYFFSKGKCRDTSLGGNDAFNCYPQFNETDDVAEHPFLSIDQNDPQSGMGRVYSEMYDDQQQIMYMTFGVPQYNNLTSFYNNAIYPALASVMNNGAASTANEIGTLIGTAAVVFVALPVLPLVFLYKVIESVGSVNITKYYEFKSAMPLYYRFVNSMIQHLTVNLGLSKDSFLTNLLGAQDLTQSAVLDQTITESSAAINAQNGATPTSGLPDVFQKNGFDIYLISLKKYIYDKTISSSMTTSDTALNTALDGSDTNVVSDSSALQKYADNFITSFVGTLYGANLFIGLRIEKGVDTSETFTNETGQSSVAQQVNSKVQAARDAKFSTENGNIGGGMIGGAISDLLSGLGGVLTGAASAVGLDGAAQILAGNGMIDFPDVWKDSSSSKNYSFTMHLRSPYGDPVSILQNLYFPLALVLCGGLPRAVGQASYTSPFVCRAYCKGMFAIPLGMISNITVKRGDDQFGWTTARLPSVLEVTFQIKDLSPALYLGLSDSGSSVSALQQIFATNSNFQEYLMTLSGMGLSERLTWIKQLRLKANYLLAQLQSSKLNPFYWGAAFGNSLPARIITAFIPNPKLPTN